MAGDLAVFDASRMIPDLPLYDHDDLGGCFTQLLGVLDRFINNLMPTAYLRRRFEPAGDRLEVTLDDKWVAPGVEFFLGIESDKEVEAIDREQSYLKIASSTDVEWFFPVRCTAWSTGPCRAGVTTT